MSPSAGLTDLPAVDVLRLGTVTAVPEFHPLHGTGQPFPVHGFVVHHPDGPIVVDTGIGSGNATIDALYPHRATPLVEELNRCGVDERDVQVIVNSHLHFDHCGQNHALSCPIAVQRAEVEVAKQPFYTVPEWAAIPAARARILDGDHRLAPGVAVLHTPGHTPGHQSVVITAIDRVVVIAAQCTFSRNAWHSGPEDHNVSDDTLRQAAAESLDRLRALRPELVLFSHDEPTTNHCAGGDG